MGLTSTQPGDDDAAMPNSDLCIRCGQSAAAGTSRFVGRHRVGDGRILCGECARAGEPEPEARDVPITMPNTNLPNTH